MPPTRAAVLAKQLTFRLVPPAFEHALRRAYYPIRLRRSRMTEEPEIRVMSYLLNPGDVVVDIGANIGLYTYWLSRLVGPGGSVYSFEPIPPVYGFLEHNIRALKLRNVSAHCVALSDSQGTARMVVPEYSSGGRNFYMSRLVSRDEGESSVAGYQVAIGRLDDLIPLEGSRVVLVKCDVEGHELQCLNGGSELIRRFLPALLVELSEDMDTKGTSAAALADRFQGMGYQPYCCRGSVLVRQVQGMKAVNTFFLQPVHAERLAACGVI